MFKISLPLIVVFSLFIQNINAKTAIVIGASSGIGAALTRELAAHGYKVGIAARRINLLKELQNELGNSIFNKKVFIKQMDVTKFGEARTKTSELIKDLGGKLDLMIVNAGIWPDCDTEGNYPIDWLKERQTVDTNVTGFTAVANVAVNQFLKQGYGHLVGISSVDCLRGLASGMAYSASKAFVSTYMEALRNRFVQNGIPIYVTDVLPGYVSTYSDIDPVWWVKATDPDLWITTSEEAAAGMYEDIEAKKKVSYTKNWWFMAQLMKYLPDSIYNAIGGI